MAVRLKDTQVGQLLPLIETQPIRLGMDMTLLARDSWELVLVVEFVRALGVMDVQTGNLVLLT